MSEINKKLLSAKVLIAKESDKGKQGVTNGRFSYFTPSQVNALVLKACASVGICFYFQLLADEYGLYGELVIVNVDDANDNFCVRQRTAIPEMKGMTQTQMYGACVTYTYRYTLQCTFGISEDTLDVDYLNSGSDETAKETKHKATQENSKYADDQAEMEKMGAMEVSGKQDVNLVTPQEVRDFISGLASDNRHATKNVEMLIVRMTNDLFSEAAKAVDKEVKLALLGEVKAMLELRVKSSPKKAGTINHSVERVILSRYSNMMKSLESSTD